MAGTIFDRLVHAWNAFRDKDPTMMAPYGIGPSNTTRPDRIRMRMGNERSIIASVYNRISIDVSAVAMRHVRVDQNDRYLETIDSGLNTCLTLEANIDQTGRAFLQDVALSLFDEGCIAIVPVDTTSSPSISGSFDILTMRTAKILEWYPYHVRLNLYNERTGIKEDIILPKRDVAIIENPLYTVMNEPNSTLQRLIQKLNMLDAIDDQSSSGKLDLIIQLPYVVKTEVRKAQAEQRKQDIVDQLSGSKYGIAYIDGTEKITQLNRPVVNNLMDQIEFLTSTLYSQLGLTESIFDGTADEGVLLNYHNRTVEPVLSAITGSMIRRFLTKTARTQGQSIKYFRDPFSLVPAADMAGIADSFTRNEILTSNEFRAIMGYRPSDSPGADDLRNKNLNPDSSSPIPVSQKKSLPEPIKKGDTKNAQ